MAHMKMNNIKEFLHIFSMKTHKFCAYIYMQGVQEKSCIVVSRIYMPMLANMIFYISKDGIKSHLPLKTKKILTMALPPSWGEALKRPRRSH